MTTPTPAPVPDAAGVTRPVVVELVSAEAVAPAAAIREAVVVEVAVVVPTRRRTETAAAPLEPRPAAPVRPPAAPVVTSPRRAVPIWEEIEHGRRPPSSVGARSEGLKAGDGEPRRRTARELLARAAAFRRAQAEPAGQLAAASLPVAGARAVAPQREAVPAAPAAAVLVEQLEAEIRVPAGIVPDDPLAPRTDLFMPPVITIGPSAAAERLVATAVREDALTEPVLRPELRSDAAKPARQRRATRVTAAKAPPEPVAESDVERAIEPEPPAERM